MNEQNIFLHLIVRGIELRPFTQKNFFEGLLLDENEQKIANEHFRNAHYNATTDKAYKESIFFCIAPDTYFHAFGHEQADHSIYTLSLDSSFKYIDYLELKNARMMANEAKLQASRANRLAFWALIFGGMGGTASLIQLLVEILL